MEESISKANQQFSLIKPEEPEDNIEPIITLRDGTKVTVVNEADNELYRHVKKPDGSIVMEPYIIRKGEEI